MSQELSDWELDQIAEAKAEILRDSPVAQRYSYTYFVSKSKGRSRPRRHWAEVELVQDKQTKKFTLLSKFETETADRIASEVDKRFYLADDLVRAIRQLPH